MPGTYTIVTRAAGTIVTASIYNSDHQTHINGRNADAGMASHSDNVPQMQRITDPYPSSVESLAPSLGGEIERLRFDIADLKGVLNGGTAVGNWYDPLYPGFATVGARMLRTTSFTVGTTTQVKISFAGGTAEFNTNSIWDGLTPSRFTAPFTGKYLAGATVLYAGGVNPGGTRQLRVGVNNTFIGYPWESATQATQSHIQYLSINVVLNLIAADYVEFALFQTSGGNVVALGDATGLGLPAYAGQAISGYLVFLGS
jgi:hypothetical protein